MPDHLVLLPVALGHHINKLTPIRRQLRTSQGGNVEHVDDGHGALLGEGGKGKEEEKEWEEAFHRIVGLSRVLVSISEIFFKEIPGPTIPRGFY